MHSIVTAGKVYRKQDYPGVWFSVFHYVFLQIFRHHFKWTFSPEYPVTIYVFAYIYDILFSVYPIFFASVHVDDPPFRGIYTLEAAIMKIDIPSKAWLKNKERFADLINVCLFCGATVILPEDLTELDTVQPAIKSTGNLLSEVRKDVCYLWNMQKIPVILNIELQSGILYHAPVRMMGYSHSEYSLQAGRYMDGIRKKEVSVTGDEYISGFPKSGRLVPYLPVIVYLGARKWDGPQHLHEMFDTGIPKEILAHVPDYPVMILSPFLMEEKEIHRFQTDLKQVFLMIRYQNDKEKMKQILSEDNAFRHLPWITATLIQSVTGMNIPITVSEEGGTVNMCKAIEDMRAEAKTEGIIEGRKEGRAEGREDGMIQTFKILSRLGLPYSDTVRILAEENRTDSETIRTILRKHSAAV